jgi:mediator of RNA polymerase II transcription subunit 17
VFRDRGFASLRRADDGTLILDKGLVPSRPKAVRVRVRREGKITGSSGLSQFVAAAAADDSVEKTTLQARDTLFEEELFHELNREARSLASSGVTAHRHLIEFAYDDGHQIILDLVDPEDMPSEAETTEPDPQCGIIAEATAHALRILLSYSHRQNLRRRSQFPPPLTNHKRPTPQYHLLRPILSYLQHNSHLRSLQAFMNDTYNVLRTAGLTSEYTSSLFSTLNSSLKPDDLSTVERLVSQFLEPLESRFSGTMANPTSTFNIRMHTSLPDPSRLTAIGTEYELSIRLPNFPNAQPPSRIGLKNEVESFLLHLITLDLTTYFTSTSSQIAAEQTSSSSADSSSLLAWESPFPHYGELIGSKPDGNIAKQIWIEITRDELSLRMVSKEEETPDDDDHDSDTETGFDLVDGEGGFKYTQPPKRLARGKLIHVWKRGDGGEESEQKTLREVIGELSKYE